MGTRHRMRTRLAAQTLAVLFTLGGVGYGRALGADRRPV